MTSYIATDLTGIDRAMLEQVSELREIPAGALNIRKDGQVYARQSSRNIIITSLVGRPGMQVEIKPGTIDETVHVPVLLTRPGMMDQVYNVFIVGENAAATIIAGCGIHNDSHERSQHDGIHEIYVKTGARLRYVEKHYGQGGDQGSRVMNPSTVLHLEKGACCEIETVQVKGIDDTERSTVAYLQDRASIKVVERLMTDNDHSARSEIKIFMEGLDSSANIISRAVARGRSVQLFRAALMGRSQCQGHLECDAIIMDEARVNSIPELWADDTRATLTHEAAIGKIAGDQIIKLMSLGLSADAATEAILNGFLK